MKKTLFHNVRELENLVEDAASFIASSKNRPFARILIQDAIERQIEEIDLEANKFLSQDPT